MLQVEIIKELNFFLKNYMNLKFDPLSSKELNIFRIQGTTDAINHRRNDSEKIKVLHWFKNIYVYIEIRFINNYLHKMISLSVFQGEENNQKKNQLFRAEWDDFNNENESRPQPHWHITRDKANYDNFSELINESNDGEKNTFEMFKISNAEIFDTKKIHFAMSSNWQNKELFIHKIDDALKVVQWMEGLLEHIKYELSN